MLHIYTHQAGRLVQVETLENAEASVWLDLLNPTAEEDLLVEKYLGISIPSREEMEEIELSSRLYHEEGAEFMTMTAIISLDGEQPAKTPVTFILKGATLVTCPRES